MDPFSTCPDRLPAPAGTPRSEPGGVPVDEPPAYRRDPDRFAILGAVPPELQDRVELRIDEGDLSVIRAPGAAAEALPADRRAPVYVLGGGGAPFVPTGRVSVRFHEGSDAMSHEAALRHLGYRIVDVPAYAPHFAWLESSAGSRAAALSGLDQVARLDDVVHVEPQMATPRSLR